MFPASVAGRIEERAVTHLYAVPYQLKQLAQRGDLAATDVGSVTQVGFGADRHPMAEGRNAGRQGPPLPLPWQGGQSPQGPGVRIELEEIEHVLGDAPGVGHAAVAVVEGANSHEVVRAFITPSDPTGFAITALIAHCRSRLPEAAVPAEITLLDSMPTTQSGKVDRRALAVREHYDR